MSFANFFIFVIFQTETKTADNLKKKKVEILQANIGLYCNQACSHCFVESSPKRKEMMGRDIAERCLHILENSPSIHTLDLTGKAQVANSQVKNR